VATRLYLVRHGRAAASWGEDLDPGLDDVGRDQASGVAAYLAAVGPLPILTSPLRRAQETAAPLAARWGMAPIVERSVGEIPSPTADLAERSTWLRHARTATWPNLGPDVAKWRSRLLATLLARGRDTVVFTHFVAINAVVGAALGEEATFVFNPGNASCTVVDVTDGELSIERLGSEAGSEIR